MCGERERAVCFPFLTVLLPPSAHCQRFPDRPPPPRYLSADGKDIKGTKQKTKPHKKGATPLYEERFVYYLKPGTPLDQDHRLQVRPA